MPIDNLEGAAFTAAVRALIAASGEARTLRGVGGVTICDVPGNWLSLRLGWAGRKWSKRAVEAELVSAGTVEAAVRLCREAPAKECTLYLTRSLAELQVSAGRRDCGPLACSRGRGRACIRRLVY
jgi:hypothetical protein